MSDQKTDNLLNLAMNATEEEMAKSWNLDVGYEPEEKTWEIIVKYSGDVSGLEGEHILVEPLLGGYAIVTLPEKEVESFANRAQVEYIEKPKRLYFAVNQGRRASCMESVQGNAEVNESLDRSYGLTGKGVLVGIVDSGIDYRHPDFRNEDGTTRILKLWDQTKVKEFLPEEKIREKTEFAAGQEDGTKEKNILDNNIVPDRMSEYEIYGKSDVDEGLKGRNGIALSALHGVFYTSDQINEALRLPAEQGYTIVPERDFSGHGTAVAGIAAGNGRASDGVYRGVAYESDLLVVKLGTPAENSFPRTTQLMYGMDVLVREAVKLGRPIAINISFGNNYGSHRGDSLLETYLNNVAGIGQNVIVTGTGNNGNDNLHTAGTIRNNEVQEVEFGISPYESVLNLQFWKNYADQMEIYLEHPSGERIGPLSEQAGARRYQLGNTVLLIYYGTPTPFQLSQELYLDFLPVNTYIDSGVWKLHIHGKNIKEGNYELWLPGGGILNSSTGFFFPEPYGTLTIPSTAEKVISVGSIDSRLNAYADFSGRGSSRFPYPKPDLVAPGVNITAPKANAGYGTFTGTSFAAPFVTGAAALMMEWGIIQRNDLFLYGEKVKAYLQRGAKMIGGYTAYPSYEVGYGTLCIKDSLPI